MPIGNINKENTKINLLCTNSTGFNLSLALSTGAFRTFDVVEKSSFNLSFFRFFSSFFTTYLIFEVLDTNDIVGKCE